MFAVSLALRSPFFCMPVMNLHRQSPNPSSRRGFIRTSYFISACKWELLSLSLSKSTWVISAPYFLSHWNSGCGVIWYCTTVTRVTCLFISIWWIYCILKKKKKREREISFPDESPSLLPAILLLSFLGGFFGRWDQGLSHLASICPMHVRFCWVKQ